MYWSSALATVMRHSRAKYHRAVKLLKREGERLRRIKLAESLSQSPSRDFWTELRKINKSNRQTVSQLDGFTSDEIIAENLSNKYRKLFSSAPTKSQDYDLLFEQLNDRLLKESQVYTVNVEDVIKGIKCLNSDKSDGDRGTFF